MDSDTTLKLATLIATTIIAIFTAWIGYKTKQIEKVASDTHKLVNYQSMLLARQHERTALALAKFTGHPEDIAQAETATRLRQESEAKQASLKN